MCGDVARAMKLRVKPGVELVFEPTLPSFVIVSDPNRLHQVISNFVNNAIKFTSTGSIQIGYDKPDENHSGYMCRIQVLALLLRHASRYLTVL